MRHAHLSIYKITCPDNSININDNNSMYFGSRSPINDFFLGEIDEVRIWDVARTAEEINTFIEEELVENQEDLLRYFDFNQGTPGADNSGISRVFDYSNVVGRHGFLNNFSLTGNSSNFVSSNFQILAVPTLSQWGLIILSLLFFIFGINSIRSKVLKPKRA